MFKNLFKKFLFLILTLSITNSFAEVNIPSIIKTNTPSSFTHIGDVENEIVWKFGNQNQDVGENVSHTYNKAGEYVLQVFDGTKLVKEEKINVFDNINLIISDKLTNTLKNTFNKLANDNLNQNIIIEVEDSLSDFIAQEKVIESINKIKVQNFEKIDNFIISTENNIGLNSLIQYLTSTGQNVKEKNIIIADDNISNIARLVRQQRRLDSKNMILFGTPNLYSFFDSVNFAEFSRNQMPLIEYKKIKPDSYIFNPLKVVSLGVDYLIEKGISENLINLLLLIPFIAFAISFSKQVLGISTVGVYLPLLLTIAMHIIGIKLGVITFVTVLVISSIISEMLNRVRLLYSPRSSLIMGLTSIIYILILSVLVKLNLIEIYVSLSLIMPIIVIVSFSEKFGSIVSSKGVKSCFAISIQTLLVTIITYLITGGSIEFLNTVVTVKVFKNLITNNPEILFLILILTFMSGRYNGLQVSEYFKFRRILDNLEE